jgi:hypothetical protein
VVGAGPCGLRMAIEAQLLGKNGTVSSSWDIFFHSDALENTFRSPLKDFRKNFLLKDFPTSCSWPIKANNIFLTINLSYHCQK